MFAESPLLGLHAPDSPEIKMRIVEMAAKAGMVESLCWPPTNLLEIT